METKPHKRMAKNSAKSYDQVFETETGLNENDKKLSNRQKGLPYLGPKNEAPDWETDGYWIETNWRINYDTHEKCLKTVFMWHNETVNVWSHLLGCIFFGSLLIWISFYLVPVFEFQ